MRPRYSPTSIPVRTGENGLPFVVTSSGVVIPIEVGQAPTALHPDPSFEDPAFTDWNLFWATGAPVVTSDTAAVFSDSRAARVSLAAGEEQVFMSTVFAVSPGDLIEHGIWGFGENGNETVALGLLSAPSGVPDFFDGVSPAPEGDGQALSDVYGQHRGTFTVPPGNTVARVFYRVSTDDGLAGEAVLDLSFSSRTGKAYNPAQAGVEAVSLVGASQAFNTVVFDEPFVAPPVVTVTTENAAYFGATALVSETGCRVYVSHRDGTNATTTVNAHWVATPTTQ